MKKSLLILSAAAALMLAGCNDYVGKEKSHPLFIKAEREMKAQEYKEAARCYEEFLLICPKSSLAHHTLGNLYCDHLNDPLRAVYHYRKWMELNPNDKTNFDDVRMLAETAKKNLFNQLKEEFKDDAEARRIEEETAKLKSEVTALQEKLKQTEEQNQKMKETLLAIKAEREKINAQTIARNKQNQAAAAAQAQAQTQAAAKPGQPAAKPAAAAKQPAGPTQYKVQYGDTLIKISKKFYGSGKYYKLILEANKLGPRGQLRTGQVLTIPAKPGK
ncbi:MAG: LysM peptidoglycan-binding domain-containing protein [Lentisphaeria bacterium]|nr:LysM peptidoglycan-binding domain-containing protein [Lentisphaeria bacterium]